MLSDSMPEGIQLLELDGIDKVRKLWDILGSINGLFDDYTRGQYDQFVQLLGARNTVWLERTDGNGILYLTSVIQGLSAVAHFVYWDKKLRGREQFTLDVLRWVMQEINLVKVNSYIPDYAVTVRKFAERVGLRQEGKIRKWSYIEGKLYDIFIYGITLEEALNGTIHGSTDDDVQSERQGKHVRDREVLLEPDADT